MGDPLRSPNHPSDVAAPSDDGFTWLNRSVLFRQAMKNWAPDPPFLFDHPRARGLPRASLVG